MPDHSTAGSTPLWRHSALSSAGKAANRGGMNFAAPVEE
jgi:hypothetical protein